VTANCRGNCLMEALMVGKCSILTEARFPFKRNRLRCLRCVNENHKKRKRLRWQAANNGCHCFHRAFLLAGACVCCMNASACVSCGFSLRNSRNASYCVWMETGLELWLSHQLCTLSWPYALRSDFILFT